MIKRQKTMKPLGCHYYGALVLHILLLMRLQNCVWELPQVHSLVWVPSFCGAGGHHRSQMPSSLSVCSPLGHNHQSPHTNRYGVLYSSLPPRSTDSFRNYLQNQSSNDDDKDGSDISADSGDEATTGNDGGSSSPTSANARARRKRDRLREWIGGGTDTTPLVRPIRMEDGSIMGGNDDDENGDELSSSPGPQQRIRAKLDSLLQGMPSLYEIIGGNDDSSSLAGTDPGRRDQQDPSQPSPQRRSRMEEPWFEAERDKIEQTYNDILQDLLQQIQRQREQTPDTIPANAEALVRAVVQQDRDVAIARSREERMRENIKAYEEESRLRVDSQDASKLEPNTEVKSLMEQSEKEYQKQEALRRDLEAFLKYQHEAETKPQRSIPGPVDNNLDRWVLERLEDISRDKQAVDGGESVLDILDNNLDELRERMAKEEKARGSIRPESLKEWQMYRSIATRFTGSQQEEVKYESEIRQRLESWKEYVEKEKDVRKRSGLARGPKLPFQWQEYEDSPLPVVKADKRTKLESRKQVNKMALEALQLLLEKSDSKRRAKLQKEVDYLKAALENNDYLDVDESLLVDDEVRVGPVDLTDVFQREYLEEKELTRPVVGTSTSYTVPVSKALGNEYGYNQPVHSVLPETERGKDSISAPNTPFFTEAAEANADEATTTGPLGSMEEQQLEAMFRRAGARTVEERRRIREQWEEFKKIEKEKRAISGLSGAFDDEQMPAQLQLKFNVSEVMRGDGDFDAEKVLAVIGPRPSRKKKSPSTPIKDAASVKDNEQSTSTIDKREVLDSLYRSVAAAGGGRFRDSPEENERQKASFEKFVEKELEMRRLVDNEALEGVVPVPIEDDVEYAEEVLSNLGPRPRSDRSRTLSEREISDGGGFLAEQGTVPDEDEEDENDDLSEEELPSRASDGASVNLPEIPEWLRREQEEARSGISKKRKTFLGSEIDDVFDDTDYDKNMRQLHEYEQRRTGKRRQMGIDISDILGRGAFESDDYADYKFDNDYQRGRKIGWGSESFSNRKADLLDYTELEISEINSLMDHKDSVYATGVSQYLPRINKPYKDFGAIFRLEGVLVDVTGLQMRAWTKVAESNGYKIPEIDDVRRASVVRPDVAVKDCLFWTDDFLECKKVAAKHREALREAFNAWILEKGLSPTGKGSHLDSKDATSPIVGKEASREGTIPQQIKPLNERDALRLSALAWSKTAIEFGKRTPSRYEIMNALLLPPDIAIQEELRWSRDPLEIDAITNSFRRTMLELQGGSMSSISVKDEHSKATPVASKKIVTQNEVMELHFKAWMEVADEFGFERPLPDETIAAFVINDPAIAIRDGYGWTDDPPTLAAAVSKFHDSLNILLKGSHQNPNTASPEKSPTTSTPSNVADTSSNGDNIFKLCFDSWTSVAQRYGLSLPDYEAVQFAMTVGPEEAISTGFDWTNDTVRTKELVEAYRQDLARRRGVPLPQTNDLKVVEKPTKSAPLPEKVHKSVIEAWTTVATIKGLKAPDSDEILFALSVGPEEAVLTGFQWTDDQAEASKIVELYKEELGKRRSQWATSSTFDKRGTASLLSEEELPEPVQIMPNVAKWVSSLRDVEMQCGIISFLDHDQVEVLLEYSGLSTLIDPDKIVSARNGYNRESQQMLGAALRLERRPDHCVVFDTTQYASAAAHEVDMRSVNLIGPFPRYELLTADLTTSSFEELSAINIRRLFGERVYDQPMLDMQQAEPEKGRRTKTKFFWADD